MGRPATNPEASLLKNRIITSGGCWLWTLSILPDGYAQVSINDKSVKVHKVSAMLYLGYTKESGLFVLHKCRNRHCFNPDHLYLGTQSDNIRDQVKDGTHHKARKTHCPKGHPYDNVNTYRYFDKKRNVWGRQCITCNSARDKQRRANKCSQNRSQKKETS